jgi:hypothetical protein
VSSGDEHLLRVQPEDHLQAIADVITNSMEAINPSIKTSKTSTVKYTVNRKVTVPSWVLDYRGHDLLPVAQKAFGGPGIINQPRLIKALRRCRLIPCELASIFADIQGT